MKRLYTISVVIIFVLTVVSGYKSVVFAASSSEQTMPKSGDLCNGTGGNGQVIRVGQNVFTLKRNADGNNQIVHLTQQTRIKTPTGTESLSNLKSGTHVTLVGGPNPDGSFTADTIVVCSETRENLSSQKYQPVHKADYNTATTWSMYINISTIVLVIVILVCILAVLRLTLKRNFPYLLFFTLFYIYIVTVLYYTLFQFQSLILLKHFAPNIILNGVAAGRRINLIPLITLTVDDIKTSFLNIVLLVPFGFGLPFITNFRCTTVVCIGALFSVIIELLQLTTGLIAHITFRIADINDVLFNTLGTLCGYFLFLGFMYIIGKLFHNWKTSENPIFRYITKRPQIQKA